MAGRNLNIRYTVDLVDRATKQLLAEDRKVRNSVKQTSAALRGEAAAMRQTSGAAKTGAVSSARYAASQGQVERAAKRAEMSQRKATTAARASARQAVSTGKAWLGFAGIFGIAGAAKSAIDFDKAMRNVNSIAQLSEKHLASLSDEVRSLGGRTAQSPKTLAEGLYGLVSSGFDANESLKILGSSARAATAGLTTTDVSARVVAAVLNSYKLKAKDAAEVSDILFRTVDRGVLTFEDLAQELGPVLPAAAQLGVGLREVGAAAATMTKQGIPVPETMTAIEATMRSLVKPTDEMKDAMRTLGVDGAAELIDKYGSLQGALKALQGTTDGSQESLRKLFNEQRAARGALALTGANARSAAKDLDLMGKSSGATNRALQQQSKSTAYQWQKLKAQAESLGISIASKILPPLNDFLSAVMKFGKAHPGLMKLAGAVLAVSVAIKAIRFVSALTGLNRLMGGLGRLAKTTAGQKAVAAISGPFSGLWGRVRGGVTRTTSQISNTFGAGGKTAATSFSNSAGAGVVGSAKGGKLRSSFRAAGGALGPLMAAAILGPLLRDLGNGIEKGLSDLIEDLSGAAGASEKGSGRIKKGVQPLLDFLNPFDEGLLPSPFRHGGTTGAMAMLSSGELGVTPSGHSFMVPGRRAAADNVLAQVPAGTAIFTGHGQAMLASGASPGEALARQLPHFATGGQVASLAAGTGLRGRKLVESVAISKAESGWNERASNANSNGTIDRGLWQINSIHGRHSTFNPQGNARGMFAVSGGGRSWSPWVAYNSGAYRAHMGAARAAVGGMGAAGGASGGGSQGRVRTSLQLGSRGPSPVAAWRGGFEAGLEGTGLWDASPVAGIVGSARARVHRERINTTRPGASRSGGGSGGGFSPGGGWAGTENLVMQAIAGINQSKTYKRSVAVNGNQNSDHNTWIKNAFAADISPGGDSVFNLIARRIGIPAQKGSWNNFANKPLAPFRSQLLWHAPDGSHQDHVHLGIRRMRKGGRVGGFTRTGTSAPSGALGALRGAGIEANVKPALARLADYLDDVGFVTYSRLGRMVGNLAQGIRRLKRGGEDRGQRVQIRRLEAAQRLVQTEQGRRAGLAVAGVERRAARMEVGRTRMGQGLRFLGIDEASAQGIGATLGLQRTQHRGLKGMQRTLARQLARANKAGDKTSAKEIAAALEGVNETIAESFVSIIEGKREQVRTAAQELVDTAAFGTTLAQGKLGLFESGQHLAGTYETGGADRAKFIHEQIVPGIQGELAALETQGLTALKQGDTKTFQDVLIAHIAKQTEQNDVLIAATEAGTVAVEEGNEKVAQAVEKVYKDRGGGLTLDYRGEGFPLGLLGVGVGA